MRNPVLPGRRDERDGAPQVGGGIERGGRDSGEAFGADQRAVPRIRDAQVEVAVSCVVTV